MRKRPELENYPRPMISQHTFSIQISIIHMIWDVGEFDRFGHQDQRIKLFVGNSLVPNWEIWEVVSRWFSSVIIALFFLNCLHRIPWAPFYLPEP